MQRPKKIHTRNLITKKKFLQLKNCPPTPHNFSNGLSLSHIGMCRSKGRYGSVFGPKNGYRLYPFWSRIGFSRKLRQCMKGFVLSIPND